MKPQAEDFLSFVTQSPTAFHAVDLLRRRLVESGCTELQECTPWQLLPGKSYVVTRNQSSLIAFRIPADSFTHFQLVSSHSDSPMLKLKPCSETGQGGIYLSLNTEVYGGPILSTWFDRPLGIAGRVMVREEDLLTTRLLDFQRDMVLIPSMPIHFNRDVNNGVALNPQVDLLPLVGESDEQGTLLQETAAILNCKAGDIVSSDLYVYNRTPGSIWGFSGQYFSCPRIDNLECAYASTLAFLDIPESRGHIDVLAVFDNEEVGSLTRQGADSTFLQDTLSGILSALEVPEVRRRAILSSSFNVSADNAHALHPNHPEKYDAGNRVRMNGGIVIKSNARQKYTTDAMSSGIFTEICRRAEVPFQFFANRSDIPGGSTLGNISNRHVSMNSVDIGLAQLAMHSSYETAGVSDLPHAVRALTSFFRTDIRMRSDGAFTLS